MDVSERNSERRHSHWGTSESRPWWPAGESLFAAAPSRSSRRTRYRRACSRVGRSKAGVHGQNTDSRWFPLSQPRPPAVEVRTRGYFDAAVYQPPANTGPQSWVTASGSGEGPAQRSVGTGVATRRLGLPGWMSFARSTAPLLPRRGSRWAAPWLPTPPHARAINSASALVNRNVTKVGDGGGGRAVGRIGSPRITATATGRRRPRA